MALGAKGIAVFLNCYRIFSDARAIHVRQHHAEKSVEINCIFRGTGLDLAQAQRLATNKIDSLLRRSTSRLAGIHLCLDAYGAHHPRHHQPTYCRALKILGHRLHANVIV